MHTLFMATDLTKFLRGLKRMTRAGWTVDGDAITDGPIYAQAFVKGEK